MDNRLPRPSGESAGPGHHERSGGLRHRAGRLQRNDRQTARGHSARVASRGRHRRRELRAGHRLDLALRGGGHSAPGFGTCDSGLVIDSQADGACAWILRCDSRAEAGVTWADFNHATGAFGLATTGGIIGSTGVAGLTLAEASATSPASTDLVRQPEIRRRRDRRREIPDRRDRENEDLFWALRGGGRQLRRRDFLRVRPAPGGWSTAE